jgi:hypothetical protein
LKEEMDMSKRKIRVVSDRVATPAQVSTPKYKVFDWRGTASFVDETAEMFRERFDRGKRAEAERPQREAEALINATFEKINQFSVNHWRSELPVIQASTDSVGAFVDLNLPQSESSADPKVVGDSARAVFEQFVDTTLPARGITLSDGGKIRLGAFAQVQILKGNVSITPNALDTMNQYLLDWDCYMPDEISIAPTQPEPERPKTFQEIMESTDGTNREGQAAQRRAVQQEVIQNVWGNLWTSWTEHLYRDYQISLTKPQHAAAWKFLQDMGLQPNPKNLDSARRHMVASCLLPPSCLTVREVLEKSHRAGTLSDREFLRQSQTYEQLGTIDRPRSVAGI